MPIRIATSKTKPKNLSRFLKRGWEKVGRDLYGDRLYRKYPWNHDETVYVSAYDGTRLVGYAHLWIEGGVAFIEELLLDETVRGQGVGKRLMAQIESLAAKRRCHKIFLDTDPELEPANSFYQACGFKEEARMPNHYAKRPMVMYAKYL